MRCYSVEVLFLLLLDSKMENRTLALMLWCCTYFFVYFEFWDGKQKSIAYVWQIIFSNISVQGGIIHPNIHGFFDGSSHVIRLPAYDFEVLNSCSVATVTLMVINWRWCLQMFFKSFTKHSGWLPYEFLIAVNPTTTVTVDDTVHLCHTVLIFRWH